MDKQMKQENKDKERKRKYMREYMRKHKDKWNKWNKQQRDKDPEGFRGYYREKHKNRLELLAGRKRPNNCDVCEILCNPVFDHDHVTGKFRGWICRWCNNALGFIKDNPEILKRLLIYLERSPRI